MKILVIGDGGLWLDRVRDDAEMAGIHTVRLEAPEGRSLPALLAPQLRQALVCGLVPRLRRAVHRPRAELTRYPTNSSMHAQ